MHVLVLVCLLVLFGDKVNLKGTTQKVKGFVHAVLDDSGS
jgi:hypothetical protein